MLLPLISDLEETITMAGYYSSQRGYGGSYGPSSSSSSYTSSLRSNYMPVSFPLLGKLNSLIIFALFS